MTAPTVKQRKRWNLLREYGCVVCRMQGVYTGMAIEIHHLTEGGRRVGHDATIPLCHYHHQAKYLPAAFVHYKDACAIYGPSLEREPQRFKDTYGTERELFNLLPPMRA